MSTADRPGPGGDPFLTTGFDPVLFDLDGVLLDGDAFTSVILRALLRRPWRLVPAAGRVILFVTGGRRGSARLNLNRYLVRLALRRLDETGYARLAERTGTSLGQSRRRLEATVTSAGRWLAEGRRVIVVTASERRVARRYLDCVGLQAAELVATEVSFPPDRAAGIALYNIGEQKVASLLARGIVLSRCLLYTDSARDLPLIREVAACALVSPSHATRHAVESAQLPIPIAVWPRDSGR